MKMLKPQDLLVVLKACVSPSLAMSYTGLATQLGLSVGEAHNCVKRAVLSGLARNVPGKSWQPARTAVIEFCVHGARYAFASDLGAVERGTPTSFGVEPLASQIQSTRGDVPVWADPEGSLRGPTISPLYRTAVYAAKQDQRLHMALALLDAIRTGRARERQLGAKELSALLQEAAE